MTTDLKFERAEQPVPRESQSEAAPAVQTPAEGRKEQRRRRSAATRTAEERAFLPAALEAVETPPSPTARLTAWTLTALVLGALLWSWLGHMDVVVPAEGHTVLAGRSKVVQAPEQAIVRDILVRDGQRVRAGETVVELDPAPAVAERDRIRHDLLDAQLTVARTTAALRTIAGSVDLEGWANRISNDSQLTLAHDALLRSELAEFRARLASIDEEIAKRGAERATIHAMIRRLDETIPLITTRAEARGELARTGVGSRLVWLEVRQQQVEAEQEREIQRQRLTESDAAITALSTQRVAAEAEFRRMRAAEHTEAARRVGGLVESLAAAERRVGLLRLVAPVDGVVQQLSVYTVGAVVQGGERLLTIAPVEDGIELEAVVLNRDRGLLRNGQHAQVKFEAFPFTRYGLVEAELVWISSDAVQDERRGLVYHARLRLLSNELVRGARRYPLGAGLNATAEILTDQRRVIDYLLSPLSRSVQEAMREP